MSKYFIKIADIVIEIKANFDVQINKEFLPFICYELPDFYINIQLKDNLNYQISNDYKSEKDRMISVYKNDGKYIQVLRNGIKGEPHACCYFNSNNIYIECLNKDLINDLKKCFEYIDIHNILYRFNAMILHSSFVEYKENAIVFSGPSGIGKSTRASLFEEYGNAEIINGDRTIIRNINDNWYAYGSPFSGSSNIHKNKRVSINHLIMIKRGNDDEISINTLNVMEKIKYLYKNITLSIWNEESIDKNLELIEKFINENEIIEFVCPPDYRVVSVLGDWYERKHKSRTAIV